MPQANEGPTRGSEQAGADSWRQVPDRRGRHFLALAAVIVVGGTLAVVTGGYLCAFALVAVLCVPAWLFLRVQYESRHTGGVIAEAQEILRQENPELAELDSVIGRLLGTVSLDNKESRGELVRRLVEKKLGLQELRVDSVNGHLDLMDSISPRSGTVRQSWPGMGCLLLIGVAILLAITNPAKETHAEAIMRHGAQKGLVEAIGAALLAELADYHNCVVFSTTTYKERTLTFGILGNAWWVVVDD